MTYTHEDVIRELDMHVIPGKKKGLEWFFKTGKGEYGEGDEFIGVIVPDQRKVSKMFVTLPLDEIEKLLQSKIHEHRLTAVMILVLKYGKAKTIQDKKAIFDFYLAHTKYVNNWDIVDSSVSIVGKYLLDDAETENLPEPDISILEKLVKSSSLWEQRIAVVCTGVLSKAGYTTIITHLAEKLLDHKHDLIHKAVGWMLREMGKTDLPNEVKFLDKYHKVMPRTMLRYAIEKFPEDERQAYLKGKT